MSKKGPGKGGPKGASTATSSPLMSLFPVRPLRGPNDKQQGKDVLLLSNLFLISVKQNKPIYRYGVNVDLEKVDSEEGGSKPKASEVPVKLSHEVRRSAIDKALKEWIAKERPSDYNAKIKYNYLFDANGSTIYTLFSIFGVRPKSESESREFRISLPLERIVDEKLTTQAKNFRVKIHKGEKLDIQILFNYCRKQGSPDITLIQEHLRALNVIMRGEICTIPTNVMTPFNVFPFKPANQFKVSPGIIANKGYSISVRPTEAGVVLNVANTVAAFHEEIELVRFLQDRFSVRERDLNKPLHPNVIANLKKEIFNKQIEAHHINYGTQQKPHFRRYRVNDISGSSMDKFMLVDKETKEPKEATIQHYFKTRYNINLKYPNLPCIVDRGRKIPLEVCTLIEKQRVLRKMDPDETAEIIKKSAVKPEFHFRQIKENVEEVKRHSQPLKEFGLDFEPRPIEVKGRELSPILLLGMGDRGVKELRPADGQYDIRMTHFFKSAVIRKWAICFLTDNRVSEDKARNGPRELSADVFAQYYCTGARERGVSVASLSRADVHYIDAMMPEQNLRSKMKDYFSFLNRSKYDHCIIVLPGRCPDWVYRYIQYLEVTVGTDRKSGENWTRTSCIKYQNYTSKIVGGRDQGKMFIANLWLKYNTKFGGINFALKNMIPDRSVGHLYDFLSDGYIFISVDVCHPAPGDKLIQSVAAVVGMWDLTSDKMSFSTTLRVQKKMREDHSTIEEVGDIGSMVDEILESYKKKKGKYPANIVILRDGVSEGQFRIVLQGELTKVKSVLVNKYSINKVPVPRLSCLVVQKRHKVRFMRKTPAETRKGPDFNIQPGTVVDTTVVHPTDFSFYLAPHKAIQGTSRAAHIYMICDEINFSQDQAQAMVHALSYLSPRCTKSTSIPTPVNLADLAAEQAKNIVISWNDDNIRVKMDEKTRLSKLNHLLANLADSNYKHTLYYI